MPSPRHSTLLWPPWTVTTLTSECCSQTSVQHLTLISFKLISKLSQLGISTSLCNWTLDFLTNRQQSVKLDNLSFFTTTLNIGVPQGCVLSPLLYSLFNHDCFPLYGSNTSKTKEIIVDFRWAGSHAHTPIYINWAVVECVLSSSSFASTSQMISPCP